MILHNDMQKIIDTWWLEQKNDWKHKGTPKNHIFISLNNLKKHLKSEKIKFEEMKELMKHDGGVW